MRATEDVIRKATSTIDIKLLMAAISVLLVSSVPLLIAYDASAQTSGWRNVMAKDNLNLSNGKRGVATFVIIKVPQNLANMPAGAENVNFHIEAGVSGGDTVAVGYLVCNDNQLAWCWVGTKHPNPPGGENKATWYWERFDFIGDPNPVQTFGAAGSAGPNGGSYIYQAVAGNFCPIGGFDFFQTATFLGNTGTSGCSISTAVLATTAGMELYGESTSDTSVVGTRFIRALQYKTSSGSGSPPVDITQGKVVYGENNECPPYKIQGKLQNSALEPGEIKVGNNQGITTACPASGARLW